MADTAQWIGRTFGDRYRVTRVLGAGAMGVVLHADDARGEGAVALKVLAPHLAGSLVHLERFVREAAAARRVSHPNVVRVRDFGDTESVAWLAMEYLEGESLQARLRRGSMGLREAVTVLRAVADALAAARDVGVLHRDVKPANVFLARGSDGASTVKLVDFGIARVQGEYTLTATGEVLGTPGYLSPEQCRGERATAASDLYSFGVMAFECVTGRLPFTGAAVEVVVQHARTPPPRARTFVPSLPAELDGLIDRLLSKDPANRPADAETVRDALGSIAEALGPGERPAPKPPVDPVLRERIVRALGALHDDERERCKTLGELEARRRETARALQEIDGSLGTARRELSDLEFQIAQLRGRLAALDAG